MPNCVFGGAQYSEGALICVNGRELKCSGGDWQETGYGCGNMSENPSAYYKIGENGVSTLTRSDSAELLNSEVGCVKYTIGAPYGMLRLYNSCASCKTATIAWSDGQVTRHKVSANNYVDIPNRAQASQIVGTQDC